MNSYFKMSKLLIGNVISFLYSCTFVHAWSLKKGLGHNKQDYQCGDFGVLNNFAWWYDWTESLDDFLTDNDCDELAVYGQYHVPMIYTSKYGIPSVNESSGYVMTFNEPNHKMKGDMPAAEAVAVWPEIEAKTTGNLLVCPSAAPCGHKCHTSTAEEWLDEFFGGCPYCCQHLATHTYICNVDMVMDTLRYLYDLYKKKIWLTEFVCTGVADPFIMLLFMQRMLPKLDQAPFVFRYAWYKTRKNDTDVFVSNAASLFHAGNTTLTRLGEEYQNYNGGEIEVEDVASHDFNEVDTQLKTLTGAFKGEIMVVLKAYEYKPSDWYIIINAIVWNFGELKSSAHAFYILNGKAAKKERIRNFFNIVMCEHPAIINDVDISNEVDRIKNLDETVYAEKMGRLKAPVC